MIRKRLSKYGFTGKKLNKFSLEIIRNCELLCFIQKKNINKFKNIIRDSIKDKEKLKPFLKYLENYIFKLNPEIYNYEELLKLYYTNKNKNKKYLDKLYLTNNICEAINSRINYYLPKRSANNADFVETLNKFLINHEFKENDIIRHDFVTPSLIYLIEEKNLNNNLKWIKYDEFIESNKYIVNKYEKFEDDNQSKNLIKIINDIESENENENGGVDINIIDNQMEVLNNQINSDESLEIKKNNCYYEDELLSDNDNNISLLIKNLSVEDNDNVNSYNKDNEIMDLDEENNIDYFKRPLKERIIKTKEVNKNKPIKRKFIYPKDDSEAEEEDNKYKKFEKVKKKDGFNKNKIINYYQIFI